MADYIDLDAALAICEKEYRERLRMLDYCGDTVALNIGHAIKALPAADVAPVVRCKDCKWFADNNDGEWFGCWLFQTIQIIPEDTPKPDDFCSYGEPKMDGGADNG